MPLVATPLSACSGIQSALDPAGAEAEDVAALFWVMVAGGAAIWLLVIGLLAYASRRRREPVSEKAAGRLIFWGGVAFPVTTLLALLAFALWLMPGLRPWAAVDGDGLAIEVTGEQFWWRVAYRDGGGDPVLSANEIRLPAGERVELRLESADVIHSFWIPSLGGKMDMIPGRTNRMSLLATKEGTYRGPCAEYCGTSHALMAFSVVVMAPDAFRQWLAGQAAPSPAAGDDGAGSFLRNGCGACHRVAGTAATGTLGPDLSHLGSRESLGAGILPNTREAIARFIANPDRIKPGSKMPAFDMLPAGEIDAIAAWLETLE